MAIELAWFVVLDFCYFEFCALVLGDKKKREINLRQTSVLLAS